MLQANPAAPCVIAVATATQAQLLGGGCTLYLAGTLVTVPLATSANGVARVRFPVPLQNSLRGAVLYSQGFVLDPSGGFAGLAVTGGVRLVLGD